MEQLNQSTIFLLKLIRQYLESKGQNCSVPDFAPAADLNEILQMAILNNCGPFIYHTIWKWGVEYSLDKELLQSYKKRMILSAVSQLRADTELNEVLTALNSAKVKYLLLKGVMLSSLYPDPVYRRAYDADIHISNEAFDRAAEILTDRGYRHIQNDSVKNEEIYRLNDILTIELHTKMFETFYEKNRAAITYAELESPSSRREIQVLDVIAETLVPNQYMIYMLCHHTKHFIALGINLRHLVDICVYVNEYNAQLDWEFIINAITRFGIKDFTLNLLYICQHHLGMVDLSFLYQNIDDDVIGMLLYDIVQLSADKNGAFRRASAHDIVHDIYFRSDNNPSTVKINIFPSTFLLKKKYMYAKKHPVLLPVAWVHRALSYLWRRMRGQGVLSPSERAELAKERVELLKLIGLL